MSSVSVSPFAEAAPSLLSLGFSPVGIIPVSVNHAGRGLAPGVYRGSWSGRPDWQKLRDETLNSFEFGLAMRAPDSGIGIVMGSRAGSAPDGTPLFTIGVDRHTARRSGFIIEGASDGMIRATHDSLRMMSVIAGSRLC